MNTEDIKRNEENKLEVLMHSPLAGDFWHVCTPEEEEKVKSNLEELKVKFDEEEKKLDSINSEVVILNEQIQAKEVEKKEQEEKIAEMSTVIEKYKTIFPTPIEEIVEEVENMEETSYETSEPNFN